MTKLLFIPLLMSLAAFNLSAQQQAANWFFGENAGLRFTDSDVVAAAGGQAMYNEGVSSISDCRGNLLFYTDGVEVWNREHELMANGTGLLGHYSATQGSVIVQHPGDCDLFYIFTVDGKEHAFQNGLQYHLVDMRLQSGLGKVVSKNNRLYAPSSEKLTAVRHSDGQSVWLISHDMLQTNIFRCYLIGAAGLDTVPVLSHAGDPFFTLDALGQMKVSPDGRRLAVANLHPQKAQIFDFDNATGVVSNAVILTENLFEKDGLYGLEFSPDSKLLYLANHSVNYTDESGSLYQFNLMAGSPEDVAASGIVVGENPPPTDMRGLQLGPDGKIYVSRSLGTHLGVVNHPNLPGPACNYEDKGADLHGRYAGWTLPNFMVSYFSDIAGNTPNAGFQMVNFCLDDATHFKPDSLDAGANYHWDFGDGETAALPHPSHVYKDTGTYSVSLMVSKNCCTDTATATVTIQSCFEEVYVPNAFSPNGDDINDVFTVYGKGIAQMDLAIFDRWGEKIFETRQPGNGWDGGFKGKRMDSGVYVYRLSLTFQNGTAKQLSGTVALMVTQ